MNKDTQNKLNDLSRDIRDTSEGINSYSDDINKINNSNKLFKINCELEKLRDRLNNQLVKLGKLMNELENEELQGEDEDLRRNGGL